MQIFRRSAAPLWATVSQPCRPHPAQALHHRRMTPRVGGETARPARSCCPVNKHDDEEQNKSKNGIVHYAATP